MQTWNFTGEYFADMDRDTILYKPCGAVVRAASREEAVAKFRDIYFGTDQSPPMSDSFRPWRDVRLNGELVPGII